MLKQEKRPIIINILLAICYIFLVAGILICLVFVGILLSNLVGQYEIFNLTFLFYELLGIIMIFFGSMGTYLIHIIFYPDAKKSR